MCVPRLATERLVLRGWRPEDRAPFAAMNADPRVMEYFPAPLTRSASDAMVDRISVAFHQDGFGLWAVEALPDHDFVGFVGLAVPGFVEHFTPCVEIGWRLAHAAWGHGYATEAARAVLGFAFERAGLEEVVSFTAVGNVRSQRVMQRLGMTHHPRENFDHPRIDPGSPLRPHVLYRMRRSGWLDTRTTGQSARRP